MFCKSKKDSSSLYSKNSKVNLKMTDIFLRNIRLINKDTIPSGVYQQARRCFVDYLSVTLSGSHICPQKTLAYINALGGDTNHCTVLGTGCKTDMQTAALINGINSHVLELDDGHRKGALHVGGTVFSALLAVAEKEDLSFKDFLYGAIVGYEATIRLACSVQPGNKLKGYHATGTCGTLGAAIGIAAALGFNYEQMKSAVSAAVTCAAGVLEMQEDNSDYKPLNVGRAAMDAVAAAYLGKAGFVPPYDAIGGKRGFLKVMTDEPKTKFLTEFDAEQPMAIMTVYMKTYAACRHTHPAIEAALTLRKEYGLVPENIESIEVEAYKLAVTGHDHTDIRGVNSAKMSIPLSVALALCTGSADVAAFSEKNVKDDAIISLTKKVVVRENEELSSWVPQKRASILILNLTDGRRLTHCVEYPKGEPENPLTDSELEEKFMSLTKTAGFAQERASDILQTIGQTNFKLRELLEKLN